MVVESLLLNAVLYLSGAGAFLGEKLVEKAIDRYAPMAFEAIEGTLKTAWSLVREGKAPEAEALIASAGLAEAVIATAEEVRTQTLVFNPPMMENGFEARVAVLERITEQFFEISRRWKMDLLLEGSLTGPGGMTLFQTSNHMGMLLQHRVAELGFSTAKADRLMWIALPGKDLSVDDIVEKSETTDLSALLDDAQSRVSDLDLKSEMDRFRRAVINARKKSSGYVNFDVYHRMLPVLSATGGDLIISTRKRSDINTYARMGRAFDAMMEVKTVAVDHWPTGVRAMWASLQRIPTSLELGDEERALVADPAVLFATLAKPPTQPATPERPRLPASPD